MNCTLSVSMSPNLGCGGSCTIPIRYSSPRSGRGFNSYNIWSQGDTVLDWNGKESRQQGKVDGQSADGSPMAWTDSYISHNRCFIPNCNSLM